MSILSRNNYKHLVTFASALCPKPICLVCGQYVTHFQRICKACTAHLPWTREMCILCAEPLSASQHECGKCQKNPPPYDRLWIALDYAFPIDELIMSAKFSHQISHLSLLAELFIQYWQAQSPTLPEVLIPVPLHAKRLRERGYNQALELARIISAKHHIPIDFTSIKRLKPTLAQASLPAQSRFNNVRRAFAITKPLPYSRVALIDDVFTTGNTVRVLSKMLRQAGVAHIEVYCMARTLHSAYIL